MQTVFILRYLVIIKLWNQLSAIIYSSETVLSVAPVTRVVLVFQALSSGGTHQTAWAAGRSGPVFASHVGFVVFSALVCFVTEKVSEASAHKTKLTWRFFPPYIVLDVCFSHICWSHISLSIFRFFCGLLHQLCEGELKCPGGFEFGWILWKNSIRIRIPFCSCIVFCARLLWEYIHLFIQRSVVFQAAQVQYSSLRFIRRSRAAAPAPENVTYATIAKHTPWCTVQSSHRLEVDYNLYL